MVVCALAHNPLFASIRIRAVQDRASLTSNVWRVASFHKRQPRPPCSKLRSAISAMSPNCEAMSRKEAHFRTEPSLASAAEFHRENRSSYDKSKTTNQTPLSEFKRMGRISISLSLHPPGPPLLAGAAHAHRSHYHHNASNASLGSFFFLIAAVTAGEVLAIFVCKVIAEYAENFQRSGDGDGNRGDSRKFSRLSLSKRRELIEKALIVSSCQKRRDDAANQEEDTNSNEDDGIDSTCSICLRTMSTDDDIRRPPSCLHLYHKTCISDWLLQQDSCPLCRSSVLANVEQGANARRRRHILWTQMSSMWVEEEHNNGDFAIQ